MKALQTVGMLLLLGMVVPGRAATVKIPFTLHDNLIVFQASIEGQTGNFILDTGVSAVLLNHRRFSFDPKYASQQAEIRRAATEFHTINGHSHPIWEGYTAVKIKGQSFRSYAVAIDLRPVEQAKGIDLLGVIGIDVWRKYEITIDYFSQEILLRRTQKKGQLAKTHERQHPCDTLSFDYDRHMISVAVRIEGKVFKLGLDSGAETNILSLRTLQSIKDQVGPTENKTAMDLGGRTISVKAGILHELQIGSYQLLPMQTIFVPAKQMRSLPWSSVDGLLGQEFLKQFCLTFNFKKQQIYLRAGPRSRLTVVRGD